MAEDNNGNGYWNKTNFPNVFLANSADFLADEKISEGIRASYQDYITKTDPGTLAKNEKGYFITKWTEDDTFWKQRYTATYSDKINNYTHKPWGWGVKRNPLPKEAVPVTTPLPTVTEGAQTLVTEGELVKLVEKLEAIRVACEAIAEDSNKTAQHLQTIVESILPETIKKAAELKP
jgi:hypothetical protein